jgi:2-polyprenyl-3-methyl-5-hydroxy-6-metoxy-1,4-benzoquinol methylase
VTTSRAADEIEHGRRLAAGDAEATWGWGTPAGQHRARRRAALLVAGGGLRAGIRVLEVGCGTGLFTAMLAESGAEILAIDISPDLLAQAQARGLPAACVRFAVARLEDGHLPGRFDAVVGSSVLHHLELRPALARLRALLRPGGCLCFAEPNMLNPQVFLERRFRRWFPYVSPEETAFVRASLRRWLAQAGFDEISIVPFDWLHPATPPAAIPLVERAGRALERVPGVREFAGSLLISARAAAPPAPESLA